MVPMKIARVETFRVPPRWLFVRVETDDGYVGWGEPVVEGRRRTVETAVHELAELLIGRDARRIRDLWSLMYRGSFYRGGPVLMSALAGLDQALWDIKGKFFAVPVYELLGGPVRDKIEVYSWIGGEGDGTPAHEAAERVQLGFRALKMNAVEKFGWIESPAAVDQALARIASVREAVGPDVRIAIDFHGRVTKPMAKILLKELEPCRPFFVEEPVLPEYPEHLAELHAVTEIPIAMGERLFSRWDFKRILGQYGVDIVQPDLSHAGGITESLQIASMAEAYNAAIAPHCPLGPIALASCIQVDACAPNFLIQEQSLSIHYNQGNDLLDYLLDPTVFEYQDGYVQLPSRPGLGIEIDEDRVRAAAKTPEEWHNPIWRFTDGSLLEW